MMTVRTLAVASALALTAIAPARARAQVPSSERPYVTVTGSVRAVSPEKRQVVIDSAAGDTVTLEYDRNTTVWLETRLGSVRDLSVGAEVRAQYGQDRRAAWVEIRGGPGGTTRVRR